MKFEFDAGIGVGDRPKIEESVKDFLAYEELKSCHDDLICTVIPADPLNVGIKVTARCTCGKIILSLSGSSDGSSLREPL
jgi:hypothetical protein